MAIRLPVAIVALVFAAGLASARAQEAPAGAASCSGCHPNSKSVETPAARLIGRDPGEIVAAMQAFKSGGRPATLMDRIAKGFSDDEIKAIAAWYGARKD